MSGSNHHGAYMTPGFVFEKDGRQHWVQQYTDVVKGLPLSDAQFIRAADVVTRGILSGLYPIMTDNESSFPDEIKFKRERQRVPKTRQHGREHETPPTWHDAPTPLTSTGRGGYAVNSGFVPRAASDDASHFYGADGRF